MGKKKVYVTRPIVEEGIALLNTYFDVTVQPEERDLTKEEFLENIKGYDGVLCMLTNPVNEETFAAAPSVKVFANYAVGYNNIDVKAATNHQVYITNTPDVLSEATAEVAWSLLMGVSRHLVAADAFTRKGLFTGWDPKGFLGVPISGKTLGVIGAGRIGQTFAYMSRGFNMPILYNARTPKPEFEKNIDATYTDIPTLMKKSDFIAIHCPYTPETHHLIGEKELLMMKETAVFINTARGPIVDEAALYKVLKEKRIFGAGLDVYEKEPELYPGLTDLDNVILLPHIGSGTFKSREDMALLAAGSIVDILHKGIIPDNCLNKEI